MGQLQRVAGDKVEALIEGHRRVSRKALGEPGRLGHVAPDGQVARLEELRCRHLPIAGALLPQLSAEPRRQRGSERLGALGGSTAARTGSASSAADTGSATFVIPSKRRAAKSCRLHCRTGSSPSSGSTPEM